MWFKSSITTPAVAAISFCLIGGTTAAHADLGDQLFKLLPDDGAADDRFGHSVAISGATAIVGAYWDDDACIDNNDCNSGSAYLFDTTTGQQLFKLLPNDGAAIDWFGWSVAISGTTVVVGARWDDDNGTNSGSAYLFDTTTGEQLAKLLANDGAAFDHFGYSVAISNTTAIVGADGDDDNGNFSGSAYLFDTATGVQITKLLPIDGEEGEYFGWSVAISDSIAIVGAFGDDDNGSQSGSAYLFDVTTGKQLFKLLPDDGSTGDLFGARVAISGETAIVGAYGDDHNGNSNFTGSAYLFDVSDPANPTQLFKLLDTDGAGGDQFGISVAISGGIAIVGANGDDDNGSQSGSAYLFDITTGQQLFKLLPDDGAEADAFGHSVAISGATAIVGTPGDDDNGGETSGSAYLFDAGAPGTCPWDLDGTGSVGASDLLALLASWGPCKGCAADFDGDGNVGASDLLALLANWGPCP